MYTRFFILSFFILSFGHAQDTKTYLARLHSDVSLSDLSKQGFSASYAYHFDHIKQPFLSAFVKISVSNTSDLDALKATGHLLYWEDLRAQKLYFEPSDPGYSSQWYLSKIEAPSAWNFTQGDTSFVLGIVDSGVDYTHEDLQGNIAYNHDDPINGIDDDNDGYVDNYYGWDFGSDDHDPMVDGTSFLAHGSSICGVAAASTNNSLGTASPAFNCRYLPVKITNSEGYLIDTNAGILYAAQMGVQVVNCSFGSPEFSQAEADIIAYVTDSMDVVVIASAGNEASNIDVYPAALSMVIGVCALNENDEKIPVSNYGVNYDISAPGASIYGPYVENQYSNSNGTSVAAAIVSGSAILLRAHFSLENATQIRTRLLNSAVSVSSMNPEYHNLLGAGRLNIADAIAYEFNTSDAANDDLDSLLIFPNPSPGQFHLMFDSQIGTEYQLTVCDVLGKLIYRENFIALEPIVQKIVNLDPINRGYYPIQIIGSGFKMSSGILINY